MERISAKIWRPWRLFQASFVDVEVQTPATATSHMISTRIKTAFMMINC